ncbi:MAG: hypothetical protein AAB875_04830 [Patescibacteria group bacterium]|mgnify:CR=1 FL=1
MRKFLQVVGLALTLVLMVGVMYLTYRLLRGVGGVQVSRGQARAETESTVARLSDIEKSLEKLSHQVSELRSGPAVAADTSSVAEEEADLVQPYQAPSSEGSGAVASADLPRLRDPWLSPVVCEDSFNPQSNWLICEPGVILDNTAAWVIPSVDATHFVNVPEGGFTYFSMGEGVIVIDGVALELLGEQGLNYLVVIRGRIDDALVDSDLNETAEVSEFVPGHAIWSIMPPGAYVSKDWFRQQLVVSTTTGGTNCGATGCSRTRIVLFDVDSHLYQVFETSRGNIDSWTLIRSN